MATDFTELKSLCSGLNLLYVEDDLSARETTISLLSSLFDNITVAVDGKDGFKKFQENTFDIVVSDIRMPLMDGLGMVTLIREENQEIPIVFLSAHNDSKYFLDAISLNIDGYILKPLTHDTVLKTLSKVTQRIKLLAISKDYKNNLEEEVQKQNKEIIHELLFDKLTGLLSRYSFFQDIKTLKLPIIMLVDIDKFKVLNEVYGTSIGSKVLQKFALQLSLLVNEEECRLYRISADEFAIVDFSISIDPQKYEDMITKLLEELSNYKVEIDEYTVTIDITIGLSSAEENGYESAKIALDYAKEQHKPYMMYSSKIDFRKERGQTLECRNMISSAIEDKRIVVVYQAIVDEDKKLVKYEALMRLRDPLSDSLISPSEFLDVSVKTGLYKHLSSEVIFYALDKLSTKDVNLSMNFTYSDVKDTALIQRMHNFFKKNRDIGSRAIFEITESQAIENYDDVKKFIQDFRVYGISIAVDDFGSGFSNFEYILEIEPDYLKIDGSLVKDIDTDTKAYTLVEAIVGFSHKLGIKVIAEYVHSNVIFEMLKELNVDEYQGFYFSTPSVELDYKS